MANPLDRRSFLKGVGAFAAALTLPAAQSIGASASKSKRPNIIFILSDDLGYGDLGCYGQRVIKTPNLDRMAAEGMKFTRHYAGSTVCAPSRCVLMTGLHTGHAQVRGNSNVLMRPEDVTVAEVLKKAGYKTGIIGKWGVGHPPPPGDPNRNGFDYFYGYLNMVNAHNYYPTFLWRNDKKVMLDNVVPNPTRFDSGLATVKKQYSHDLFTEEALKFVEDNKSGPFFLYLPYTIPHTNNEADRAIGNGMEVPDNGIYEKESWPEPKKGHAAMITRMDRDIGRLFDKLKSLGIDENTVVMFSSDNGPHSEGGADPKFFNSNGPLRGKKRDLYEGGVRVPLIARWPGKISAGSITDHISAFWDFLPTCAELADTKSPDNIDGISYLPTLLGEHDKQKKHKYLYWEFHERGGKQAVLMDDFKAVRLNAQKDADGPLELYDLQNDLGEQENIAASRPDMIAKMEKIMKAARTDSPLWPYGKSSKNK